MYSVYTIEHNHLYGNSVYIKFSIIITSIRRNVFHYIYYVNLWRPFRAHKLALYCIACSVLTN